MPQVDDRTPLTIEQPDGDVIQLPTWSGIIYRLEENLTPSIDQLTLINSALDNIDKKLDDWITNNA
jgi:hypothetical protein